MILTGWHLDGEGDLSGVNPIVDLEVNGCQVQLDERAHGDDGKSVALDGVVFGRGGHFADCPRMPRWEECTGCCVWYNDRRNWDDEEWTESFCDSCDERNNFAWGIYNYVRDP